MSSGSTTQQITSASNPVPTKATAPSAASLQRLSETRYSSITGNRIAGYSFVSVPRARSTNAQRTLPVMNRYSAPSVMMAGMMSKRSTTNSSMSSTRMLYDTMALHRSLPIAPASLDVSSSPATMNRNISATKATLYPKGVSAKMRGMAMNRRASGGYSVSGITPWAMGSAFSQKRSLMTSVSMPSTLTATRYPMQATRNRIARTSWVRLTPSTGQTM